MEKPETTDMTAKDWNRCPSCEEFADLPGGEVNQPGEHFKCSNCGTELAADYVVDKDNRGEWILLTADQYDAEPTMGGPFVGVDGATEQDMLAGVDPGVRRLVTWLRENDFNTTDSGDGKTKFAQGFTEEDGVCPYPHVAIVVEKDKLVSEADRLADLLYEEHGVAVEPMPPEGDPPRIDASYCPATETAMIMLLHVTDDMLDQPSDGLNEEE